jgi:Predicted ATPase of the ABC class
VIERSSIMVHADGSIEARFNINLPARGRTICGDWASTILVNTLPRLVQQSLLLSSLNVNDVWHHLHSIQDQESLRAMLHDAGLCAFVCNGAILPRASGASDLPLQAKVIADSSLPIQQLPVLEQCVHAFHDHKDLMGWARRLCHGAWIAFSMAQYVYKCCLSHKACVV